ncbi:chromatin associated protein KTI12 [Multifurca ochricompacta]|uniref:Chromatin associated protein KTI12 n=1 Tax=Multifurca ochricompacta TaxID=376703 RepID=A0AAD4M883_9AGAM|nr:chromatin associated protein KTI12 [Multifurca ochricompacta]
MALVTFTGYPSSGKTHRAIQLKGHLDRRLTDPSYSGPKLKVIVLSDDALNIDRSSYNDSLLERTARGALFDAIQRQMGRDTILIIDALNYIKGLRYQLYCAAREFKLRVCTVYVVATPGLCRRWNSERSDGRGYTTETLDNLIARYEEPSSMVRWDSPLFTVPWSESDVPIELIWKAVTEGNVKPPNVGTQAVLKAPSDALHTLEQVSTLLQAVSGVPGGHVTLNLSETLKPRVTLPERSLTLSELQRMKRQFVTVHKKAITLGTVEKGTVDWSEESVAHKFIEYLENNKLIIINK